ncbi:unnamed protein product [Brassicogethes aeneus]|uniref:Calponin-homology (CH) domain-containing protein n=1 Tax=Brassicogethes aeneus TaxID=1431903 RepID=A0A9P0BAJ6_BRAAE|nr:unnamed protein product [Brassicogethes aeneus]
MFPLINWIIDQFAIFVKDDDNDDKLLNPFSIALYMLFPVSALIFVLAKKEHQSKLLVLLDRNCISVICPSFSKRRKILKWASGRLPLNWSSHLKTLSGGIVEFWNDGSLLCTLINTAVPGACPNPHRHWKKSPVHAQAVAYKYLGVLPQFTHKDFEDKFPVQERRFINFLYEIHQAINTGPSEKDVLEQTFSVEYLARGMGLCAGERHRKVTFYIYPHKKTRTINTICITIRGPFSTFGKRTFNYPNVQNFSQSNNKTNAQENNSSIFASFALDLTLFLGKDKHRDIDDIPVEIEIEKERIRVTYIPKNYGMYEIKLLSDNEIISGSPYNIHIIDNTTNKIDTFDNKPTKINKPVHIIKDTRTTIKGSNFTTNKNPDLPIITIKDIEKIIEEKAITDDIVDLNNSKNYHNQIKNNNKLRNVNEDKCIKSFVDKFQASPNCSVPILGEITNVNKSEKKAEPIFKIVTSPICPNHIVPEVVEKNLNDKRKSLQKQSIVETIEDVVNSSFSDSENEDNLMSSGDFSKSLPNLSESCQESKSIFLKNKAFWETVSKSSLNTTMPKSTPVPVIKKNIFSSLDNVSIYQVPHKEIKTYKSIDNSLDYCTIFTIKQRKQFLMKTECETDNAKMNNISNCMKFTNFENDDSKCKPQGNNCSDKVEKESISTNKLYKENFIRNDFRNADESSLLKSHFSNSVKYFKQLERTLKPKKKIIYTKN